jgi:hypothetical protein
MFGWAGARRTTGKITIPVSASIRGIQCCPAGCAFCWSNIQRFSADTNSRIVLVADWTFTRHGNTTTEVGFGAVAAIFLAMSRALGRLADRITAALS